jgi:hypothetical protein
MLKWRLQSAGGRVGDFFAGEYVLCAAEETERAYFGAFFLHCSPKSDSRICLNFLARKKSSLLNVINHDSVAQQIFICLNVI